MSTHTIIFVVLTAICLVILGVAIALISKSAAIKNKYDERQKIEQGKGYKYSFWVFVAYLTVYAFVTEYPLVKISQILGLFIGLALSVTVNAIYCIYKDAYVSFKENIGKTYTCLIIIMVSNLMIFLMNFYSDDFVGVVDGKIGTVWINLVCVIMLLVCLVSMLIKQIIDKAKEKKGEI